MNYGENKNNEMVQADRQRGMVGQSVKGPGPGGREV